MNLPELIPEQNQQLQLHKQFPEQILRNALRTPDGTVIESKHRHDFVCHTDAITQDAVCVDGGHAYLRRIGALHGCTEMSVTTKDEFNIVREYLTWGTYGKDGKQPKTYVKLSAMTAEHIRAVLDTQQHICGTVVEQLFKQELLYRGFIQE